MTTNRIGSAVGLRSLAAALVLALSAFAVRPAVAQSLGESARKEKERRAKLSGQKSKAYTDRDVGRAFAPPSEPSTTGQSASGSSSPSSSQGAPGATKPEEDPTKTESYWRNRVAEIQKRISDLEGQLSRPGFDQDPTNLSRRQRIERDVEKARADLVALAEEARRKGVPAGWLR